MTETQMLIDLGLKIKKLRLKKSMTQNELSIECNFEKASMSRIESGQTNPTIKTLYKICTALDVHISDLFKE